MHTPLRREDIIVPEEKLRKGLLEGVQLEVYFPGFPTFKHLQYTVSGLIGVRIPYLKSFRRLIVRPFADFQSGLEARGVKVFQSSSQGLNMIVKIIPQQNDLVWENLLTSFVNKTTFVGWPYLTEAKYVWYSVLSAVFIGHIAHNFGFYSTRIQNRWNL